MGSNEHITAQVEHGVTEMHHPGLDIVELMIRQGVQPFSESDLDQRHYKSFDEKEMHAIEVRVYCENPSAGFTPSPGLLQHVSFPQQVEGGDIRIDTWVSLCVASAQRMLRVHLSFMLGFHRNGRISVLRFSCSEGHRPRAFKGDRC